MAGLLGEPGADLGLDPAQPVAGLGLLTDPNAPGPFKRGFGAGVSGVKSNLYGAGALLAHGVGAAIPAVAPLASNIETAALARSQAESEAAAAQNQSLEQVDWTSPSSVVSHLKWLLGNAVPSLALMAAGGAVGRGFGALAGRAAPAVAGALTRAGTFAGAVAPDVALEAGGIYPEALNQGVENPALRSAVGGVVAASFDFLPLLAAEKYLKAAGKGGFGALVKGAVKGAPLGAALEGTQEALQSAVERYSAGQSLTSPDAISDYANSFVGGAVPGAVFGGVIGAHRSTAASVSATAEMSSAAGQPAPEVRESEPVAPLDPATLHAAATAQASTLEASLAAIQSQHEAVKTRLGELKAEADLPIGERRTLSEIVVEKKALSKQVNAFKTQTEKLGGDLHAARQAVTTLAAQLPAPTIRPSLELVPEHRPLSLVPDEPSVLNPAMRRTDLDLPVNSDVIANPHTGQTAVEENIAARVSAHLGDLAFPRPVVPVTDTSYRGNYDRVFGHPIAPVVSRARSLQTEPNTKAQLQAIEPHAMSVIEPMATELAKVKSPTVAGQVKVAAALTKAMRSVVREAAREPSVEAAQAHVLAAMPAALKGLGVHIDAPDMAKAVSAAVGLARGTAATSTEPRLVGSSSIVNEPLVKARRQMLGASAMRAAQPVIAALLQPRGMTAAGQAKVSSTITKSLGSVAEAAAEMPLAEARAHIATEVPAALNGRVEKAGAAGIVAAMTQAVEHTHALIAAAGDTAVVTRSPALDSAWGGLNAAEQQAIEHEVGRGEFELAVVAQLEGKKAAVKGFLARVSETVRAAFRKVVATLMAVVVALHIANVQEARAVPLPSRTTTISVQTLVDRPKVSFAGAEHSAMSELVSNWVMATKANDGKAFVVADKAGGKIFAFDERGALVGDAPALFGEALKDTMTPEQLAKPLAQMTKADKITPAGKWTVTLENDKEYGWALTLKGGNGLAVHSVYLGTPSENRLGRLASATPADNFISWGCINVPPAFAKGVMETHFAQGEHALFILPVQSENTMKTFGIMEQDLMPSVETSTSTITTPDQGVAQQAMQEGAIAAQRQQPNARGRRRSWFSKSGVDSNSAVLTQTEFEALPPDAKNAAIDAYNAVMTARGIEAIAHITQLIGTDPNLTIGTFQATPGSPVGSYTRTGLLKSLVSLALNAKDMLGTADHEGFHYAEDQLLTSAERQIVRNAVKPGRPVFEKLMEKVRAYDIQNQTNLADEVSAVPAEARAYAFEFWRRGELQAEGAFGRIFAKIMAVLERIANYIRGVGFKSMEDVFAAFDRGQFALRERNAANSEGLGSPFASESGAAPWYKSALTDSVAAMFTTAASAQGWKEQIKGLVGKGTVKQAEIEAVGLNEFLDLQSGRVTKDRVVSFLRENGVRVEEVELGKPVDNTRLDELDNKLRAGADLTLSEQAEYNRLTDMQGFPLTMRQMVEFGPSTHPKLSLPGGTNYRELLLTLPGREPAFHPDEVEITEPRNKDIWVARLGEHQMNVPRAQVPTVFDAQILAAKRFSEAESRGNEFRSSHFDQLNILAHIRFNERTDAQGKRVLFIEEIQSDWAQKGRGIRVKQVKALAASKNITIEEADRQVLRDAGFINAPERAVVAKELEHYNVIPSDRTTLNALADAGVPIELRDRWWNTYMRGKIPSAPFVTKTEAWVGLSIKRMIRYAAENGFDKVAWTNGEQQVERYDLSKQLDYVRAMKAADGTYMIAGGKGGQEIIGRHYVAADEVADVVGEDLAEKILQQPTRKAVVYSGLDLKVGGEGMKAFYDKIVPNVANDVLKKLGGGKVSQVLLSTHADWVGALGMQMDEQSVRVGRERGALNDQPGFTVTPELARHAAEGLPLFSRGATLDPATEREAVADITRRVQAGELEPHQFFAEAQRLMDDADVHAELHKAAYGATKAELGGSLTRWWQRYIATPNYVAAFSVGFKNVMSTLNTYIRYRETLIETKLREQMPEWYKASFADQDAAFAALLKRTLGDETNPSGFTADSREYQDILVGLDGGDPNGPQHKLVAGATRMVEGFLRAELAVDTEDYKRLLTSPGSFDAWLASRKTQVDEMINRGYVPLRRYGDHVVTVYKDIVGKDGRTQRLEVAKEMFTAERGALITADIYKREIARQGAPYTVEVGYKHKTVRDTTVSVQQFLDTARRNGVEISQTERERLVKALSAADAQVRSRMLRREGMPGYSRDGMRVLNEFGVNMSGKIAYSKFGVAIDSAADGHAVQSDIVNGEAQITIDQRHSDESVQDLESRNLWKQDGPKSGFYRNLADELSDYVLVPDNTGTFSRKLRGAAMAYFIGGSISGAVVNTMSVPMLLVPRLSIYTNYANAMVATLGAWKQTWQYQAILRDIARLRDIDHDPKNSLGALDDVPGLRAALIAASDKLHDTELHQIMSISQGNFFSQSRSVQKAMEVWMAPFRISEQTNRITSFIAAYKVGQANGLKAQELFGFARDMVDSTQNNYSEANRPGAARNPVFAMMFMFKSFPLFMTEAIHLMYKASPKSAVFMLLGLVAMTGVQGLPFAETIEDLIDTISQQAFNSPFNTRRAMRNVIKSASEAIVGYDLSELVLRGTINSVLGVSASSRIGAGDFVPGSRLGTADADQGRILEQFLGAPYAMVKDGLANIGGLVSNTVAGDWKGAADALRAGGPVALRNAIKGVEQLDTGYASDSKGRMVVKDIPTFSAILQLGGLSSAAVARAYELEGINIQTKSFHAQFSAELQNQLIQAMKAGNTTKVQEISDLRVAWNQQYPGLPIMPDAAAIRRGIMLSGVPLDRRSQMLWSRRIRGANVFSEEAAQ